MKTSIGAHSSRAELRSIGVLGAGAWGTALAFVAHQAGRSVRIWAREDDVAHSLSAGLGNPALLPDVRLPALPASTDLAELAACDALLATAPAQFLRATLQSFRPHCKPGLPVALCSKGVERGSLRLMTEVLRDELPEASPAVLSGPSFARDVALGLPTAVTLACPDPVLSEAWVAAIGRQSFRPYRTDDLIGAEVGGAVKNVLAIACGVCEGAALGRSAHAALLARGFAEMTRLGVALGGRAETLAGLSGLGDLVLTCSSPQSRNMSFGIAIGCGASVDQARAAARGVVEGADSAEGVVALARRSGVEMPICEAVAAVVSGAMQPRQAIDALLNRPFRGEA
ncbi:NAD(P)H-dependent glycerol-3-phosphate dehydrogenase [bacterium]|nr:NAD(P)H-dependent glycerol-3-phosphate dehydrogenase [bacterium]